MLLDIPTKHKTPLSTASTMLSTLCPKDGDKANGLNQVADWRVATSLSQIQDLTVSGHVLRSGHNQISIPVNNENLRH